MNFILVFLICFVIFVLWMFYEQRKSQNKDKEASDAFWERERMANQTRKKDISHLPILHVEESELPVITTENESVLYYIDHIRKIIKSPMLDLSEYSNTDLKLAYGVGNFKVLCEYDENFNHFLLALTNLLQCLNQCLFMWQGAILDIADECTDFFRFFQMQIYVGKTGVIGHFL